MVRKLLIIGILVGAYLLYKNAEQLPNPFGEEQSLVTMVTLVKEKVPVEDSLGQVKGVWDQLVAGEVLAPLISNIPEEIIVDETLAKLATELQHLPQSQVKRIKVEFCQDVINEATQAMTPQ
jgi:hypothetical protein